VAGDAVAGRDERFSACQLIAGDTLRADAGCRSAGIAAALRQRNARRQQQGCRDRQGEAARCHG
jgi:hypothetical protein